MGGKVRRGKRGFSEMANDICTCKWNVIQLLCSFVVPELLKSALVFVLVLVLVRLLPFLLLLFLHLLLFLVVVDVVVVVVVVVAVVVVAAAHLIFAFLRAPENRQIGGVFAFFHTFGAKNTVDTGTDVLSALETQNQNIYSVFVLLIAKITVFTIFFGTEQKH